MATVGFRRCLRLPPIVSCWRSSLRISSFAKSLSSNPFLLRALVGKRLLLTRCFPTLCCPTSCCPRLCCTTLCRPSFLPSRRMVLKPSMAKLKVPVRVDQAAVAHPSGAPGFSCPAPCCIWCLTSCSMARLLSDLPASVAQPSVFPSCCCTGLCWSSLSCPALC